MNDAPCKDCPRKGCGSYHEQCKEYTAWRDAKHEEAEKQHKKDSYTGVLLKRWWL